MKKKLIHITGPLLRKLGLKLLRRKDYERQRSRELLLMGIVDSWRGKVVGDGLLKLEMVIFSKDRALQLHALLASMFEHVSGSYSVRVLYCASTDEHLKAYQDVADLMLGGPAIEWCREDDFQQDLIKVLRAGKSDRVCFLVDDIVFIRPVDFDSLSGAILDQGILSLRLGRGIDFCYTKQKPMKQPALSKVRGEEGLLQFSWGEGQYDWAYPLSVDGHVFPRHEMIVAVESLDYRAPNSFEGALQLLNSLYSKRSGYCFELPRILNIPLNRVQDEKHNISADVSPEYLLEKWNEGMMMDYMSLAGVTTCSVHQELDVKFCRRSAVDM